MPSAPVFVLASASPRRLDLLKQAGITPDHIHPAEADESSLPKELPGAHALRLAEEKAKIVAKLNPGAYILAADTVVGKGRRILPKAEDNVTVTSCLKQLSGGRHRVYTGLCLVTPEGKAHSRLVQTIVNFKRLEPQEIEDYLKSGEGLGKAGGYAIQGKAAMFVKYIGGSYTNVVGLPLYETVSLLRGAGVIGGAPHG